MCMCVGLFEKISFFFHDQVISRTIKFDEFDLVAISRIVIRWFVSICSLFYLRRNENHLYTVDIFFVYFAKLFSCLNDILKLFV